MSIKTLLLAAITGCTLLGETTAVLSAGPKSKTRVRSVVPLEQLVRLNSKALFGNGTVTVKGDRVEVLLHADGHLLSSFIGKGLMDSTHPKMRGANRRFIEAEENKLLAGFTAVGYGRGMWTSRFPLAGETMVSFEIRIPNILTHQAALKVRINSRRGNCWETSFFTSVSKISGGISDGTKITRQKGYQGVPSRWFPRQGAAVPVEFGIENGTCRVRFGGKDMVSTRSGGDRGGKVVFLFNKILFTIQNLKISGKLDLEWCAKELARLEKRGKLIEKAPKPETPKPELETLKKGESDEDL